VWGEGKGGGKTTSTEVGWGCGKKKEHGREKRTAQEPLSGRRERKEKANHYTVSKKNGQFNTTKKGGKYYVLV